MVWAYILRCADGSFYVGQTSDLGSRIARHNEGTAARWTAARRPVVLAYAEHFSTLAEAVARERQLKRWTHAKKAALADGGVDAIRRWSRSGRS